MSFGSRMLPFLFVKWWLWIEYILINSFSFIFVQKFLLKFINCNWTRRRNIFYSILWDINLDIQLYMQWAKMVVNENIHIKSRSVKSNNIFICIHHYQSKILFQLENVYRPHPSIFASTITISLGSLESRSPSFSTHFPYFISKYWTSHSSP